MDLWTAVKVIGRQWLLLSLALLVVAGVVGAMYWHLRPTYSAKATVLLLPPTAGGAFQPTAPANSQAVPPPKVYNPYLSFDSSLDVLASVVAQDMTADATKKRVLAEGATAKYDVTTNGSLPGVTVVATDEDPHEAVITVVSLVDHVSIDLNDRQGATGVPKQNWVTASALDLPATAQQTNTKLKVLAAVAGLGLLGAISLAFVAESLGLELLQRRRPLQPRMTAPEAPRRDVSRPVGAAVARNGVGVVNVDGQRAAEAVPGAHERRRDASHFR
jgi:capsular polysaccharide biosynthesis protein